MSNSEIVIALDAMGGDGAPDVVIRGANVARVRYPQLRFMFFGKQKSVAAGLERFKKLKQVSTVHHADEVVADNDKPVQALRKRHGSSMRLAIDAVGGKAAHGVVSAGNTGALMALSKIALKTLPGIGRPAMGSIVPTVRGESVMLDLGANIDCDSMTLAQFAVMGEVFARNVLGVSEPTVGLLNIGTEELKGSETIRAAAATLRDSGLPIKFHGFVEADDIAAGTVDVIATDGFAGNIALKSAEGTARLYTEYLKSAFRRSLFSRVGYLPGAAGAAAAERAGRSPRLQRRDVLRRERGGCEEPRRHRPQGLRQRHRRRLRHGEPGDQSQDHRRTHAPPARRPAGAEAGRALAMRRSRLVGCGAYLPDRVLGNDDLAARIDTSDEWIRTRTGIRQRHVAADDELTSDLACAASRAALAAAGVRADALDLVVLATSTPDNTFPATATKVQAQLGMTGGVAFDVQAVCAGFVCALSVADSMVRSGAADTALIVGAETYSRILDWDDRQTCVLFGDGAGAAVLRAEEGSGSTADRGVLAVRMRSDGRHYQALYVDGGGLVHPDGRLPADAGAGGVPPCGRQSGGDRGRGTGGRRARHRRRGLAGPPSGEPAHHRRDRQEARDSGGEDDRHRRPPRQHLVGLHPACAQRRHRRRADQAGGPAGDRGDRRRPRLGCRRRPPVRR